MKLLRTTARITGYVWAAPTTLAALLAFLLPMWLSGQIAPLRWMDGVWEWSIHSGSWFWRRYTLRGWNATTLGWCVFYSPHQQHDARIARHERRHVWQALCLGPLFFPVYAALWLVTGYVNHPMERDAVAFERRAEIVRDQSI